MATLTVNPTTPSVGVLRVRCGSLWKWQGEACSSLLQRAQQPFEVSLVIPGAD